MRGSQPPRCRLENLLAHPIDIGPYGVIVEADNLETSTDQILGPRDVFETALMLLPVELNDECRFQAHEIGNIAADRMLTTKLQATELPTAQPPPEVLFDVDRRGSHVACA